MDDFTIYAAVLAPIIIAAIFFQAFHIEPQEKKELKAKTLSSPQICGGREVMYNKNGDASNIERENFLRISGKHFLSDLAGRPVDLNNRFDVEEAIYEISVMEGWVMSKSAHETKRW